MAFSFRSNYGLPWRYLSVIDGGIFVLMGGEENGLLGYFFVGVYAFSPLDYFPISV